MLHISIDPTVSKHLIVISQLNDIYKQWFIIPKEQKDKPLLAVRYADVIVWTIRYG